MDERQKAFDAFEKTGLVSVKAGLAAGTHGTWTAFAQEWVTLREAAETIALPTARAEAGGGRAKPGDE